VKSPLSAALAGYPWDALIPAKQKAAAHPGGIVDLSVGTPKDDTPQPAQNALAAAANSPGYPSVTGPPELAESIAGYLNRRWRAGVEAGAVLPTVGSKEFIAALPTQLGLGSADVVVIPAAAYPTYAAGAAIAGCRLETADDPADLDDRLGDDRPGLVWLNSPSNPTGEILSAHRMRRWVEWARRRNVVLACDECYAEFGWDAAPRSVLDPEVSDGDHRGLLAVHSLSKTANLAGYRAGFVAGDAELIADLVRIRRHAGMMIPAPVQQAMIALLATDEHIETQRARYARRRCVLRSALQQAGFAIEHSQGSLYLWATRHTDCWDAVGQLADLGILVAPGTFYAGRPDRSGAAAGTSNDSAGRGAGELARFVRVALTAPDERIDAAAARLTGAESASSTTTAQQALR
jgi:succinyldiaminopimelate transaminase